MPTQLGVEGSKCGISQSVLATQLDGKQVFLLVSRLGLCPKVFINSVLELDVMYESVHFISYQIFEK